MDIKGSKVQDEMRASCVNIITNHINKPNKLNNRNDEVTIKQCKKAKKFLNENKDILLLRSDKTSHTVAMLANDYYLKMNELLSDKDTYMRLDKDPTNRIQSKNNKLVLELFKKRKTDFKVNPNW